MKLKDRVAIVTGTSPNIGGGIAEGLAAEGAIVVAVDARAANARDCAAYIEKTGGRALGVICDVTDEAQVASALDAALKAHGKVDILVNNAAFFNRKGVLDMPFDEWNKQTGVILGGRLPVHQARLPGDDRPRLGRQRDQHRLDGGPSG